MGEIRRPAPRWQQIAATMGCATPLVLVLLVVVANVAGAPPEHAVISKGGQTVAFQVAFQDPKFGHVASSPIAPTTSLADARCQAWRQTRSAPCPDSSSSLAREFWPTLQETPGMLYVGTICDTSTAHFNVEYVPISGGRLYLHCHSTAPWISFQRPEMGVTAQIVTTLVVVPTSELGFGQLSVWEEDRVERWLDDQINLTELGVVTLST